MEVVRLCSCVEGDVNVGTGGTAAGSLIQQSRRKTVVNGFKNLQDAKLALSNSQISSGYESNLAMWCGRGIQKTSSQESRFIESRPTDSHRFLHVLAVSNSPLAS